ncbi:GNAT family N-acetyltransferase [Thalassoglobus sp. JC818]|uniref:GNAT family N-acetyltransferase n=1 Tax=Thalassoglobus sp. JC818 TaxID=3232136 RepID=UPI003459B978
MSTVSISIADFDNPRHAQAIVDCINAYATESHGGGAEVAPEIASAIVPGMKRLPGAFTLLAWDGDKPVGAAICFMGFSTFAAMPLVNIHDLSVMHAYRGQGIGSRLIKAVESHARELGCCKVTLEVRKENPLAEQLYLRLGFGDPDGFETRFLDKKLI